MYVHLCTPLCALLYMYDSVVVNLASTNKPASDTFLKINGFGCCILTSITELVVKIHIHEIVSMYVHVHLSYVQ